MKFRGRKQDRELVAAIDRGRMLFRDQDDELAREFLADAARRFPGCPEFPLLLASLCRESRPKEVAPHLAKAVKLGFNDPVIQVRAGHAFLDEGDVEAARACAARAENLINGDFILTADLESLVGGIASRDGEYTVAEEKLRSALHREPEFPAHALALARFLWARGRNEAALAVIDESLDRVAEKKYLERLRLEIADEG